MSNARPSAILKLLGREIFISYRREFDGPTALRIADRLVAHYGTRPVFVDIKSIEPGECFPDALRNVISRCRVGLVVIGPSWAEATDESGKLRLKKRSDVLRQEVEQLLSREKGTLIPVLLDNAQMPKPGDLPKSIVEIRNLQCLRCRSGEDFETDISKLIASIDKKLGSGSGGADIPDAKWPSIPPSRSWNVANHSRVRDAFCSLLSPASQNKVMLIRGDRGCGKTAVTTELAAFAKQLGCDLRSSWMNLKVDIANLAGRLAGDLGVCPAVDNVHQLSGVETLRRVFRQAAQEPAPTVLIFDAYEDTAEYADWVKEEVLHSASSSRWLRVVISGNSVPDINSDASFAWRESAIRLDIKPVTSAADWLPLFKRRHPKITLEEVEAIVSNCMASLAAAKDAMSARSMTDALNALRQTSNDAARLAFASIEIAHPDLGLEARACLELALKAAAITHWIDADSLVSLTGGRVDEGAADCIRMLRQLSAVERLETEGICVHDGVRRAIRRSLQSNEDELFLCISKRASSFFLNAGHDPRFVIEAVYHQYAIDAGSASIRALQLAQEWEDAGLDDAGLCLAGMLQELIDEGDLPHGARARTLTALCSCRFFHQSLAETEKLLSEALHLAVEDGGSSDEAECHFRIGLLRKEQGNLDEAEASLRTALALRSVKQGGLSAAALEGRQRVRTLSWLGHVLRDKGCYQDARSCFLTAHDILIELTKAHPQDSACRHQLAVVKKFAGYVCDDLGYSNQALASYQESLEMLECLAASEPDNIGLHLD